MLILGQKVKAKDAETCPGPHRGQQQAQSRSQNSGPRPSSWGALKAPLQG